MLVGELWLCRFWVVVLTWLLLGDIGMTDGRTAGEFPDGVPKSGRGGMKGVAGSESGMMMDGCCWEFFYSTDWTALSHGLETKGTERK